MKNSKNGKTWKKLQVLEGTRSYQKPGNLYEVKFLKIGNFIKSENKLHQKERNSLQKTPSEVKRSKKTAKSDRNSMQRTNGS